MQENGALCLDSRSLMYHPVFIGEIYKLFSFPERHAGFKQKPHGTQNRPAAEQAIRPFAIRLKVPIVFHRQSLCIDFGDYPFSAVVFEEIIK